ncbi:MAG: EAL domain-containing protein, partial [Pseudomonadota bacterium]
MNLHFADAELGTSAASTFANTIFWRYIAALSVIVALLLASHLTHLRALENGLNDEEKINVSGRQRMLSQRMLYTGLLYLQDAEPENRAAFVQTVDAFEAGHDWIVTNALIEDAMRDFYLAEDGPNLHQRSLDYIAQARSLLAAQFDDAIRASLFAAMDTTANTDLLEVLNEAVGAFEAEAYARNAFLVRIQSYSLFAALFVLLLEVLIIFYPTNRALLRAFGALDHQANHDALTGLANRKRMGEIARQFFAADRTDGAGLVAVGIDLDGFKAVNDTLGHPMGDLVLRNVASLLQTAIDETDGIQKSVIARLGGDEFAVVLTTKPDRVEAVVGALSSYLLESLKRPMRITHGKGSTDCSIGMSLGYATAKQSNSDPDTLISNADIALYEAKRAGKHRIIHFQTSMRDGAEQRHEAETELRHAILNDEFVPFFQPQVSFDTGALTGVEALARWHHPKRGWLTPQSFWAMAEECGMAEMLEGGLAFRSVEAFAALRDAGVNIPTLGINVSPRMMRDANFAADLVATCNMFLIDPSDVEIEVMEDVLAQGETGAAYETISALAKAGCRVVVDDFGVGYSSLSTVSMLDIKGLKLDRS